MEGIIRDMAKQRRTILFSTHVMEHAERLCDRILLISAGRLIFDGSIARAKRTVPRRIRIETDDGVQGFHELPEVRSVVSLNTPGDLMSRPARTQWELELRENADPQKVLSVLFRA